LVLQRPARSDAAEGSALSGSPRDGKSGTDAGLPRVAGLRVDCHRSHRLRLRLHRSALHVRLGHPKRDQERQRRTRENSEGVAASGAHIVGEFADYFLGNRRVSMSSGQVSSTLSLRIAAEVTTQTEGSPRGPIGFGFLNGANNLATSLQKF